MSSQVQGRADYLDLGNWNAQCALCGRKRKASDMNQIPPGVPGAGLYKCKEHEYKRNPQDFVRGIPDDMTPPWVQDQVDIMDHPTYYVDEDADLLTIATSAGETYYLSIYEGATLDSLVLSGTGTVLVNNWGIVLAVTNPGPATITLNINQGVWP